MKILVKEIDQYKSGLTNNQLSEYLIYLMDDNGNNIQCEIVYGLKNKTKLLIEMMHKNGVKTFSEITLEEHLKNIQSESLTEN